MKVKQRAEARCDSMGSDRDTRTSADQRGSQSLRSHHPGYQMIATALPRRIACVFGSGIGGQREKAVIKGTEPI